MSFNASRRSVVYSTQGVVASTQPLASAAGIRILELGGNSVDASIAVASVLAVVEPASTGVGGDCFMLHYDESKKKVVGLNGTGRSPKALDIDHIRSLGLEDVRIPLTSIHSVTVPGTIAGWIDAIEKYGSGRVGLDAILAPAIKLCKEGHIISEISAYLTGKCWEDLERLNGNDLLKYWAPIDAPLEPPNIGSLVQNRKLAELLQLVADNGKDGFYKGVVAESIIEEMKTRGGLMDMDDLAAHKSDFVDPIYLDFLEHKIWEIPPNSQGLVVLLALGIIRELDNQKLINLHSMQRNSVEYLHMLIECLKLAFYDSDEYVSDPNCQEADILHRLLSKDYLKSRAKLFSPSGIIDSSVIKHGVPNEDFNQSDTVYFTVSDPYGNVTSFINSLYDGFGSCIVPRTFGGFALQNRGANFNLTPGTKNSLEPSKRPYHTIIPSIITSNDESTVYGMGNMGGFMQPSGHVQHFLNLILFGLNPQESLDSPRCCLSPHPKYSHLDRGRGSSGPVNTPVSLIQLEEDIPEDVFDGLVKLGHEVEYVRGLSRSIFGRGQIIKRTKNNETNTWLYAAGSDKRGDGAAVPLI